jgi:hypothetical protein
MKLGSKGIGWLIFGAMIIFSVTESDGWRSALSTIVLGAVFVSIYFMKQKFDTDGIGWYICGGTLMAFLCESESLSDMLFSLVLAVICLGVFYRKNKAGVDDMIDDIDQEISDYSPEWMNKGLAEGGGPEVTVTEETVEVTADQNASDSAEDEVEFEIEVKE